MSYRLINKVNKQIFIVLDQFYGNFSASLIFKLSHQNESLKMWQVLGGPDAQKQYCALQKLSNIIERFPQFSS